MAIACAAQPLPSIQCSTQMYKQCSHAHTCIPSAACQRHLPTTTSMLPASTQQAAAQLEHAAPGQTTAQGLWQHTGRGIQTPPARSTATPAAASATPRSPVLAGQGRHRAIIAAEAGNQRKEGSCAARCCYVGGWGVRSVAYHLHRPSLPPPPPPAPRQPAAARSCCRPAPAAPQRPSSRFRGTPPSCAAASTASSGR